MQVEPNIRAWLQQNLIISSKYIPSNVNANPNTQSNTQSNTTEQTKPTTQASKTSNNSSNKATPSTNVSDRSNNNAHSHTLSSSSSIKRPDIIPSASTTHSNWLQVLPANLDCPYCLEPIQKTATRPWDRPPEVLIKGNCGCRQMKPIHTRCLLWAMEQAVDTMKNVSGTCPAYIFKCQHCQVHLLGDDNEMFNTACLEYKRFFALSKDQQQTQWLNCLPNILNSLEVVIQNIWLSWRVQPLQSYNPILAAALGVLAGANSFVSTFAHDAIAGNVAVFAYMMSWYETGPSAMFNIGGVEWVLQMVENQLSKENGEGIARMVLPSVVAYLIVVIENWKGPTISEEAQHFLVVVIMKSSMHDSVLQEMLWKQVAYSGRVFSMLPQEMSVEFQDMIIEHAKESERQDGFYSGD